MGHPFMMSTQKGEAGQAQVGASGWGGWEVSSMWTSTKELEPTDIILSSSHAKQFAWSFVSL